MENNFAVINSNYPLAKNVDDIIRVIGIDLGTTNSAVAEVVWYKDSSMPMEIRCIELEQKTISGPYIHWLLPSAVAIYNENEWIGEGAKRLYARAPEFGLELSRDLFVECKNDIGSRRTYHRAPGGYNSPTDISGRILKYIYQTTLDFSPLPISHTSITVPASFQLSQRSNTIEAAKIAGIPVGNRDLFDEPLAAFLDYLVSYAPDPNFLNANPKNLLVFDFGGGTCDVAILKIGNGQNGEGLEVSPLAVSRYHRLGGADIDRAILYEILVAQLLEQNHLSPNDLSYEDKKNHVEPALIGVAEALKIGICTEITRLLSLGKNIEAEINNVSKTQPGLHKCELQERTLKLSSPSLNAYQFNEILEPFLDTDLIYAQETEYRLTCSIFAPLQDALDRCNLEPPKIDLCLLVGGSALIPQVITAVAQFFYNSQILTFPNREAVQVAVARGAAINSLSQALYGKSAIQAIANDSISIITAHGSYELIPKGACIPYPPDGGWIQTTNLKVPKNSLLEPVTLRVEIVAGDPSQQQYLLANSWEIPAPINQGDRLLLKYHMDENQVLEFELTLQDNPYDNPFVGRIESPLTNVVNPNQHKIKIEEAEEELRRNKVLPNKIVDKIVEIAINYHEIDHTEKAISYLKNALRIKNQPDHYILNLLGIYSGDIDDYDCQEKYYWASYNAGGGDSPLFNLALTKYQRHQYEEAKHIIDKCIEHKISGPALTLAAQIEADLKNKGTYEYYLNRALEEFKSPPTASKWELGWLIQAARMANQSELLQDASAELSRRKGAPRISQATGLLPDIANDLGRE